ncbi:hypothetical protein BGW38_000074 [Lunasporangiospora selenospora]|uniref:uroporphyrinogen-III C-methyltransferase n=1 Tax=Lunasporangiospora selenospora TaxID=979761 RepID=A0A9P6KEG8_9FUNG|nr:hypothetical protein BGW38_000074 [Lunasporangiospora selenospora]
MIASPYDSPPSSPLPVFLARSDNVGGATSTTLQQTPDHTFNPRGQIKLIGAGPGDPDLLTMAAYKAITSWADIVLADKLVPKEILDLITCKLFVANKNKGCQASGQQELFERATEALQQGFKVVRLKQGDPFIFGRGGEEYLFFRRLGYEASIVPGISSSIGGPLLANIPLTHRGVATQFLVCTGTGSHDTIPDMPTYDANRTTVFLMALHRLEALVEDLKLAGYPDNLPLAIVERASSKDQRCIRATIGTVVQVVKEAGYRPPGILVTGWACNALA